MGLLDSLRGTSGEGGEVSPSGSSAGESPLDTTALREEIQGTRKPRADKGKRRGSRVHGGGSGEITQEEVDALFQAENWEALAALPFETRYIMTGWAGFRLSDDERKRMAQTTATTMKILLKIDPKYIALAVWGTLYFGTWAAKEATYSSKKQEAEAMRKARSVTPQGPQPAGHPNAA